ncbi:MAG TPA: bifunctional UDP-N-acetylglucosamine diphosphorylase/glucosamine-1-phosphate N-acetyltransferase GlmU [Solirubrobacteraceae bacterium]|nr:bifunctional UDP-N-acetylglucosamine diphosphorylase/glucosamine-1-phosphate N-acetyltransferase GlmU [Solirubrobacteraceae bacterium]
MTAGPARVDAVIVLAAGEGRRMHSATPKVLHEIGGHPLLAHVLRAVTAVEPGRVGVVVGHGRDEVSAALAGIAPDATVVVQEEQRGTGHATRLALESLSDLVGAVLVAPGDTPLLTPQTMQALLAEHGRARAAATMLTATAPDPTGYGRVVRDSAGAPVGIVEEKDASDAQRQIDEVGTSIYVFDADALRAKLSQLKTDNAQGEEYLTDVIGLLVADGATVAALRAPEWSEVAGVNDRAQLAVAGAALRDRVVRAAQLAGAMVTDPATTWVDVDVVLEPDCTIEPFTMLHGRTTVAAGAVVGPYSRLVDTAVGRGARVVSSTCVGAEIGAQALVGPYSHLRPGTRLAAGARVGGFVEVKNAEIGAGSKVPHLSYIGDTTIGERSNIGAATVTVNYDGTAKHHTTIGDDVFIGSDTMLVAPVEIGDGAYTAAGSVITEDVPPGALAIGRARQVNKPPRGGRRFGSRRAKESDGASEKPAGEAPDMMRGDTK